MASVYNQQQDLLLYKGLLMMCLRMYKSNKSTTHTVSNARLLLENSKSKKEHNYVKNFLRVPALLVWVPLLIVNRYFVFQVNIFR